MQGLSFPLGDFSSLIIWGKRTNLKSIVVLVSARNFKRQLLVFSSSEDTGQPVFATGQESFWPWLPSGQPSVNYVDYETNIN